MNRETHPGQGRGGSGAEGVDVLVLEPDLQKIESVHGKVKFLDSRTRRPPFWSEGSWTGCGVGCPVKYRQRLRERRRRVRESYDRLEGCRSWTLRSELRRENPT